MFAVKGSRFITHMKFTGYQGASRKFSGIGVYFG